MATIETLILLVFVLACAPLVRYILGRQSKLVEADNVNSHVEKGTGEELGLDEWDQCP